MIAKTRRGTGFVVVECRLRR